MTTIDMHRSRPTAATRMKAYLLHALCVACCLITVPAAAPGQETVNYASVSGRVTDAQGAVVPAP
jgi:hypothetical protein